MWNQWKSFRSVNKVILKVLKAQLQNYLKLYRNYTIFNNILFLFSTHVAVKKFWGKQQRTKISPKKKLIMLVMLKWLQVGHIRLSCFQSCLRPSFISSSFLFPSEPYSLNWWSSLKVCRNFIFLYHFVFVHISIILFVHIIYLQDRMDRRITEIRIRSRNLVRYHILWMWLRRRCNCNITFHSQDKTVHIIQHRSHHFFLYFGIFRVFQYR